MGREIAAVDRRYVAGPAGADRVCHTNCKMAAKLFEPVHGRERRLRPVDEVESSRPPKVAGADGGQEVEAHVGR